MKFISPVLVCLIFQAATANAQTDSVKWNRDTLIEWADFKGPIKTQSPFDAETKATVRYWYHWHRKNGVYELTFKVESYFLQQQSWSITGKQTDALLTHERLHNDINEIFARKLLIAFNNNTYTSAFRDEIKAIFDTEHKAAQDMQDLYDEETNHSKNKLKQAEWELYINKQLDTLPRH